MILHATSYIQLLLYRENSLFVFSLFTSSFSFLSLSKTTLPITLSQAHLLSQSLPGKLMCDKKHINENPIVRYRVEVQVVHKDDKANFLLWDNHVTSIVGITAADLKEELIKVGKYHPKMYPPVLDQLISPKRVWKIKAMPGSNPFSVIQFSDNEQLLKNLEKQFGLEEASSKLAIAGPSFATNDKDGSKVNTAADDNNGETENSQSLCGENDPTSTLATPPPKRRSQDEVDLVAYSQDIEATQLSSTKLAKQPKLEPKN